MVCELSAQLQEEVRTLTARPALDAEGRLCARIDEAAKSVSRSVADALDADRDRDFARHIRLARAAATALRDSLQMALVKRCVSEADLRAVRLIFGQFYPALTALLVSTANFQSETPGRWPSCTRPSGGPSRT
jgi:four helix bundle protein